MIFHEKFVYLKLKFKVLSKDLAYQLFIFKQRLAPYEARLLRSATISVTKPGSVLYHNHIRDGFRYDYPLIQYKSLLGQAAILYLGEAVNTIGQLFRDLNRKVKVKDKNREIDFTIDRMRPKLYKLMLRDGFLTYDLIQWMPLQDENFGKYRLLESDEERLAMLRRLLRNNILSFARGVDWEPEGEIVVKDLKIYREQWVSYKTEKFKSFNVRFRVNAFLPPYIGLGKGAAMNYGVVYPVRKKKVETEQKVNIQSYE